MVNYHGQTQSTVSLSVRNHPASEDYFFSKANLKLGYFGNTGPLFSKEKDRCI